MNALLPLTAALLGLGLSSCTKASPCDAPWLSVAFVGLPADAVDTLVVRRFAAGTGFGQPLDTLLVTPLSNGRYYTSADTTTITVGDYHTTIKPGYDWQVVVPALRKTVTLTNLATEQRSEKVGWGLFSMDPAPPCQNPLFSLRQDGQPVTFAQQPASSSLYIDYRVYIRR